MKAGLLNTRCRIEYKAVAQDATYGTDVISWTLLATVWCEFQDVLPSRSESLKQGVTVAANQSRVRLRYRTDINSSMRLVIGSTTYQIIGGPAVLGNKEGIELVVEKYSS